MPRADLATPFGASTVRFIQPAPMRARVDWEGRTYEIEIRSMVQDSERDQNGIPRSPMTVIGFVIREGHLATGALGRGRIMVTHAGYTEIAEITRMRTTIDHGITTLEVRAYPIERRPHEDSNGDAVIGLTPDEMALRRPGETVAQVNARGHQALREIRAELAGIRQGAEREPNLREVWAD